MKDPFSNIKLELKKQKSLIFWDCETSPMKFWGWRLGEQLITHEQIIEESKIITIQWMFEGHKVEYLTWDSNQNDSNMLEKFSNIMQNVRVAVTQNGRAFDHRVLRWRLNLLNLTPLKNVEIIDTLQLSRTSFEAPSHKLDYRSKAYKMGGKMPMHLIDWINVVNKKPGALEKMVSYACKDVKDLRNIMWKEMPYYQDIPISLATLVYPEEKNNRVFCPRCASYKQTKFDIYPTKIGNKIMYKCNNCNNEWKETRLKV